MSGSAQKRFVAVNFTSGRLQIVYLSPDKKSVESFSTVEIPQGLIVSRKVVDAVKLAAFIQTVWQKNSITQKYVGVVVPEFSTYIKTLKLPIVDSEELDEAVRWQAQDVIPTKEETVLDWKILEKTDKETTVLAVSIKKSILSGYIEAVEKAGLYPLVLETPSLSLARVSDHSTLGKVVIYQSFDEALILIAKGDDIYGSSITSLGDENIISTALRIAHYYESVKIERVVIGGINISQNLFDMASEKFSVKPECLVANVQGFSGAQLQEFMVPISLSFKDTKEPRDETTVNLLPADWAKQYEMKRFTNGIRRLLIASFVVFLILLTISSVFLVGLQEKYNSLLSQNPPNESEVTRITQEATDANKLTDRVIKASSSDVDSEKLINAVAESAVDVSLTRYNFNFETGQIEVLGIAPDRSSLISFKNNLDKKGMFEPITIPLSLLESENNIDFNLQFKLKKEKEQKTGVIQLPDDFIKQQ